MHFRNCKRCGMPFHTVAKHSSICQDCIIIKKDWYKKGYSQKITKFRNLLKS